jgi:internalin A
VRSCYSEPLGSQYGGIDRAQSRHSTGDPLLTSDTAGMIFAAPSLSGTSSRAARNIPMKSLLSVCAFVACCALTTSALAVLEPGHRMWHRANGEYIGARKLIGVDGDKVRMEKEYRGGVEVFDLQEFSGADVRLIKVWQDPIKRPAVERAIELGNIEVRANGEIELEFTSWQLVDDDLERFVAGFPEMASLKLPHCGITHEGIKQLALLKKLRKLSLWLVVGKTNGVVNIEVDLRQERGTTKPAPVIDPGFKILAQIESLEDLELEGNGALAIGKHFDDLRGTKLKRLTLNNARLSADDLQRIAKIDSLEYLSPNVSLISTGIQPPLLRYFKGMKNLRELNLDGCRLTDEDADHLADLAHLSALQIFSWSPKGFEALAKNCQNLESLRVLDSYEGTTKDSDLASLNKLKHLKELWLGSDKITNDGLAQLAMMNKLEELYVPASITPDGLRHLEKLRQLKRLRFGRNYVEKAKNPVLLSHALDLLVEKQGRDVKGALAVLGDDQEDRFRNFRAFSQQLPDVDLVAMQKYGAHFQDLETFSVGEKELDDWMSALAPLKNMRYFQIFGTRDDLNKVLKRAAVTKSQMKSVADWKRLEVLEFHRCDLQPDALEELTGLRRLEEFELIDCSLALGSLAAIGKLPSLTELSLQGTEVSTVDLSHLNGLANLEELTFSDSLSAEALAAMKGLKRLKKLEFSRDRVTFTDAMRVLVVDWGRSRRAAAKMILQAEEGGEGQVFSLSWEWVLPGAILSSLAPGNKNFAVADNDLEVLADFPELERLKFPDGIGDEGFAHLASLKRLRRLLMGESKVTDAGLVHLQGLEKLEHLYLGDAKITDAGLKYLRTLTKLQTLEFEAARLTDEGVKELAALESLIALRFNGAEITSAGLDELAKMTNLRRIGLGIISEPRLEEIRTKYPHIGFNGLIPKQTQRE